MKDKLYIIASTWKDTDLTIETFRTNHKAVKNVGEYLEDTNFRKPDADEILEDYLGEFWIWVREEQDNQCDINITYEIVEL